MSIGTVAEGRVLGTLSLGISIVAQIAFWGATEIAIHAPHSPFQNWHWHARPTAYILFIALCSVPVAIAGLVFDSRRITASIALVFSLLTIGICAMPFTVV